MEEDIKILEEMKANCIKGMMKGAIYTDEKAERKAQALENLIKGYRELEEKNKNLYDLGKAFANNQMKIKIKNKIEYLEDNCGNTFTIMILKEILEDK